MVRKFATNLSFAELKMVFRSCVGKEFRMGRIDKDWISLYYVSGEGEIPTVKIEVENQPLGDGILIISMRTSKIGYSLFLIPLIMIPYLDVEEFAEVALAVCLSMITIYLILQWQLLIFSNSFKKRFGKILIVDVDQSQLR